MNFLQWVFSFSQFLQFFGTLCMILCSNVRPCRCTCLCAAFVCKCESKSGGHSRQFVVPPQHQDAETAGFRLRRLVGGWGIAHQLPLTLAGQLWALLLTQPPLGGLEGQLMAAGLAEKAHCQ